MSTLNINDKVAVIGAGTMGAGIAQVAAAAGHQVILLDIGDGVAQRGVDGIKSGLDKLVVRGKKSQQEVDDILAKITPTQALSDIKGCRLVIEAIVENIVVKRSVLADVEALVDDNAIFASNTSSISISAIAAEAKRPENVVGMHFFNPAAILKLVEVVSGLQTSDEVAKTVFETAAAWGKKPVYAKSTPGFIVNRVARPFYAEALRSVTEQFASVETIDTLMRSCGGFKMGPLELTDLIGQDVNCAVTESVYNAFYQDKRYLPSVLQAEMVSAGLLGRKSGRGFYSYPQEKPEGDVNKPESVEKIRDVSISGNLELAPGLARCLVDHGYGIDNQPQTNELQIEIGEATIKLSDGRTASRASAENKLENLVLLDYAKDYQTADCVALTFATNTTEQARADAIALFESLGKQVHVVKDVPGMQVLRTVCMLINEAYDAINQGVCSYEAVDIAMQSGVAYPMGPIAWSEQIGIARVVEILSNIQKEYGEERYRVSPLLNIRAYD